METDRLSIFYQTVIQSNLPDVWVTDLHPFVGSDRMPVGVIKHMSADIPGFIESNGWPVSVKGAYVTTYWLEVINMKIKLEVYYIYLTKWKYKNIFIFLITNPIHLQKHSTFPLGPNLAT